MGGIADPLVLQMLDLVTCCLTTSSVLLFCSCAVVARWEDELLVTRAPGRLDVMGGIADYSGSLVLQMPIAEACHVALQRHPLDKQQVWKHIKVCTVCIG
jgi:hypothetical protein